MRSEYDLKGGKKNPYARRLGATGRELLMTKYLEAENLVKLDEDVAAQFDSAEAVNEALRLVLRLRELAPRGPKKAAPPTKRRRRRATAQ